jgi:hypothetical protein
MVYCGLTVYAVIMCCMVGLLDDGVKGIWMEMHVVLEGVKKTTRSLS